MSDMQVIPQKRDLRRKTLLIIPGLCPLQCSNQISLREIIFNMITFYGWLQLSSRDSENTVIEHVGAVFALMTGADGRGVVLQREDKKEELVAFVKKTRCVMLLASGLYPPHCIVNFFPKIGSLL